MTHDSTTPSLTVYKASAGSGKTFRLAVEYMKLLIRNPQSYRQILAVTFTNKATEEMKMRILSQLYGLWRRLYDSKAYMDVIGRELGMREEQIAERAGMALHLLLHNYSYFRVETIDSFFQSVLRNLARELDLTVNYSVSLNDRQVEELAVDQLIESLKATDLLLKWLMQYIMDNIGDDRSWNVIWQIKEFGRNIFRDTYKQEGKRLHEVLTQRDFFDHYTAMLRRMRTQAKKHMAEIARQFFDTLEGEGLTADDLSYGKGGVAGLFYKMLDGVFDDTVVGTRITDCQESPEKWCKKNHARRELIVSLASTTLGDILNLALAERPRQWKLYQSADQTLRHLSQLRLLNSIEEKVNELNSEANRFLLSDTQQLLHELIEGSDSPFIFEKIGTQLEHIMIDEFQDTSTVQWQNFKVMLEETMSHKDSHNLIVGDVKQSIYRWRSGDWRLLANIRNEFARHHTILEDTLNVNRRSCSRIVDFNNAFFLKAAETEQAQAYGNKDEIRQEMPEGKGKGGYVSVELLPAKDYQQQTLDHLTEAIGMLIEKGTRVTDIAILVRKNDLIPLIANHLMALLPEVPVVSDEAFRLDASTAVTTIVSALRALAYPEDAITRAYLARIYSGRLDGGLPEGFNESLLKMPLYDIAEHLYGLFRLDRMHGQSAYLCAFYDRIATFINDNTSDITAFLKEWDERFCGETIQSPEVNGIRIISIHKSKGLEFPHVFIPFCDWKMEHSDILWCKPQEEPFNQLPIVPIDYSQKGMRGTIYESDYEEEHQQNTVDNLNLLYVAFTRAKNSLHVFGKRNSKSQRSALIESTLPEIAKTLENSLLTGIGDNSTALRFEYGDDRNADTTQKEEERRTSDNPFLQPSTSIDVEIEVFEQKVDFRQSNKSREFADPDADDEQRQQSRYIQLGSVLHEVFSTIRTTDDVERALKHLETEGIVYDSRMTRPVIENMIRKRLADPRVAKWFDARWHLFNECTILNVDPTTSQVYERRPDRVITDGHQTIVIDYKFGTFRDEYRQQVLDYMELLRQMGHQHVSGYLWFVYSNMIREVK